MGAPILLADKKLRTKTLHWTFLLAVLGLIGILSLMVYLDELIALQHIDPQLTAQKYTRLLLFLGVAHVLISCGAGGALGFIFCKTLRAKQFPPPGIRLMWDAKLRTGNEARRIAIAGVAVAVVLTLCGIGLGTVMISIARAPVFGHTGPFLEASVVGGACSFS